MRTLLFHINYLLAGGIEKVLIELLNALDPNKYHVRLSIAHHLGDLELLRDKIPSHVTITYLLDTPFLISTRKKKISGTINPFETIFESLVAPVFRKQVQKRTLKELIKDVDVIIDYDMTLASYHNVLKRKKTIAYCHFSLANYWDGKKNKLDKLAYRLFNYDKVIMLCDEMKTEAANLYPFLEKKLVRLYNAIDVPGIKQQATAPLPKNFVDHGDGFFISVGRLNERQKDTTNLIKSYARCVHKYDISQKLVIVGDGPGRKQLEQLALQESMKDNIIFTGFDHNPYRWIGRSSLVLFSSKFEGLPTVLIEAHCLSKPIIATGCPTGVRELLMDGKAGTLVEPGDADAFCEAIYTLVNDTGMQQSYHDHAQALLPQFEISNVVTEFEKIIAGLFDPGY